MRTRRAVRLVLISVLVVSSLVWAQAELEEFPPGTTQMAWRLAGEGVPPDQTLRITIAREGDEFTVELVVAARGKADELGLLGFLGSALGIQAPGTQVDLSVLSTVLRRPELLQVGEEYLLPGGRVFLVREQLEVAGVLTVIGEYREPGGREIVEIGIPLADPVYFLPLLRVHRDGQLHMEMELVEYVRP